MLAVLDVSLDHEPASDIEQVLEPADVDSIIATAREVMVAQPLREEAVELLLSTRADEAGGSALAREHFRYGASPRGLQSIVRAARVRALLAGRAHVARADIAEVALPALRHRVLLNMDSEIHGVDADEVLRELIAAWAARP